jgi:hypothetical protein
LIFASLDWTPSMLALNVLSFHGPGSPSEVCTCGCCGRPVLLRPPCGWLFPSFRFPLTCHLLEEVFLAPAPSNLTPSHLWHLLIFLMALTSHDMVLMACLQVFLLCLSNLSCFLPWPSIKTVHNSWREANAPNIYWKNLLHIPWQSKSQKVHNQSFVPHLI